MTDTKEQEKREAQPSVEEAVPVPVKEPVPAAAVAGTADFDYLEEYDPTGRKAWYPLPLRSRPSLRISYAGQTNKPYINALGKLIASTTTARRLASGQVDIGIIDENLERDRILFPKFIITEWRGVLNAEHKEVPFTPEACEKFLRALPDWIMERISNFAQRPMNFLEGEMPDELTVQEQAGN